MKKEKIPYGSITFALQGLSAINYVPERFEIVYYIRKDFILVKTPDKTFEYLAKKLIKFGNDCHIIDSKELNLAADYFEQFIKVKSFS